MVNPAQLEAAVSKIRATNWTDPNDLAQAIATALSSVSKHQTYNRGLHDDALADKSGGTQLAPGNPSAGRKSQSLQTPQLGFMIKHGAVATRRQARVESDVITVPCMIISVDETVNPVTMDVVVVGDQPLLALNDANQWEPGSVLEEMEQTYIQLDQSDNNRFTVSLAGIQFSNQGIQIPIPGQTVNISIAKQYEKTTVWQSRASRIAPKVSNRDATTTACLVNGFDFQTL